MESCKYCGKEDPNKSLWVQCSLCPQWVHVDCIPLKDLQDQDGNEIKKHPKTSNEISHFQCDAHNSEAKLVTKVHKKKRKNSLEEEALSPPRKRYSLRKKQQIDYIALNEGDDKKLKKVHPHAEPFLKCFAKWENHTNIVDTTYLNNEFFQLREPLKIKDPENSGMRLPTPVELGTADEDGKPLTVDDITKTLGDDIPVDVMDVQSQQNERWTLSQWNQYFSNTSTDQRDRIRNVISLEVSHFDERFHIDRPRAVEENDLVNIVWQSFGNSDPKPKVTRYVLMSAGNSYTDFHLDFAGTSVYYNLVSGHKKFILFPPTDHNLKTYTDWCQDLNQNLVFLGDLLDHGIAMELNAGDLFMLPSGWIHAVYTPVDSLIIGGNFLTVRDIKTQLRTVQVERLTKVPKRFTFPMFDTVMGKTCEWVLSLGVHDNQYQLDQDTLLALQNYMKLQDTKYKPLNYPSKRSMVKKLDELIDLNQNRS